MKKFTFPSHMVNHLNDLAALLSIEAIQWNAQSYRLIWSRGNQVIAQVRLPVLQHYSVTIQKGEMEIRVIKKWDFPILIFLINSGYAALGVWQNNDWVEHRTIQKYMVRKSRGKSQLKYLNQKGKSRLGSRIRLRESKEFIEEIIAAVNEWQDIYNAKKILYACPPGLWGELMKNNPPPFWERKDTRLQKIPIYHNRPNYAELNRIMESVQLLQLELYQDIHPDRLKKLFDYGVR